VTVRMKDIAQRLGVSVSTVSLALSGHTRIPERTRRRVEKVAHELGYRSPRSARATELSIAIVLTGAAPASMSYLYFEAMSGIIDEASTAGAVLQVMQETSAASAGSGMLDALKSNGAQGAIIVGGHFDPAAISRLVEEDYPFICVGKRELPGARLSWVASDYVGGAQQAVKHLVNCGHQKTLVLSTSDQNQAWLKDRVLGYRLGLEDSDLCEGPHITWHGVEDHLRSGPKDWLRDGITAVFAIDHVAAARLLTVCANEGVRVPDDLAVVGFDDIPGAVHLNPPLTTVRQPMRELGGTAARTLLSWLRGASRSLVQIRLQPELIVRASCGANRGYRA